MKIQSLYLNMLLLILSSTLSAQTGHWEKLNPPVSPSARSKASMTSIGNSKALLFGGEPSYGPVLNDTWIFDLDTRTWSELKPKNSPPGRMFHFICKLDVNTALLFGGIANDPQLLEDTWIFNLLDTSWTKLELDTHPFGRSNCAMSQIDENFVLLYGGKEFNSEIKEDTWLFDLENKKWTCIDSALDWWNFGKRPFQRWDPVIAPVSNKKVILHGGYFAGRYYSDTWLFDLNTKSWKQLKTKGWIDSVTNGNAINLFGTKMLLFGGENDQNNTLMFDLYDTTWTKLDVNQTPPAIRDPALAQLEDGKAVLFGTKPNNDTWLFTAEINGIDGENSLDYNMKISPNPATDFIEIALVRCPTPSRCWTSELRIFNVFGELVYPTPALPVGEGVRIDVSGLLPGIYFVRVGEKVRKFVKI